MSLVIEDGTGKPDANSYIDLDEAKLYASLRGVDLGTDETITTNLVLSADYINAVGPYRGTVVNPLQRLAFPRRGLMVNRQRLPDGVIPSQLREAQAQLLLDIKESGPLTTTKRTHALKSKKLEGLEFEYAVGSYVQYAPTSLHQLFDSMMAPFRTGAGGSLIR